MDEQLEVVAATVIRVAPEGFTAPYVLAAVRTTEGLSLGRVEGPATPPAPGTALRRVGQENDTPVYRLADG
ncbi:MAG: OB-fold domain-containing protein [Mycobacteriales bacterium]